MEKDPFIYLMMNVPKKQIRFRPVLQKFFPKQRFHFLRIEYISIHRKLFRGIYKHAGKIRDYNITKKEFECVKTSFKFSIGGYY